MNGTGRRTAGTIGAESSYRLSPAGVATGNVTFYPKINTLTARTGLKEGLSKDRTVQKLISPLMVWVWTMLPLMRALPAIMLLTGVFVCTSVNHAAIQAAAL